MARESLESFLEFMREKPRTWGWDAIVAYDRNTANDLLMQEYIERFDGRAFFETLTFAVEVTGGWQVSEGQRLDKPRLKFEDASLANSTADLSMRIVGGRQFHVDTDLNGGYRFNSLKLADALNGPVLHVRLELGDAPGEVEPVEDGEAKIVIDMSKKEWTFYLTFTDYPEENELGGARYKELFAAWDDDKKKFTLNTLKVDPDDFVQPAGFVIRTHAEPQTLGAMDYAGEGAVLLFVKMQGSDNGSMPAEDRDFHYLLPAASPPYSANIIFSQKFFMQRLVAKWFERLHAPDADRPFRFETIGDSGDNAFFEGIRATQGVYDSRFESGVLDSKLVECSNGIKLAFAPDEDWGEGEFVVSRHEAAQVKIYWKGRNHAEMFVREIPGSRYYVGGETDYTWEATGYFSIEVDHLKRCVMTLESLSVESDLKCRDEWYEGSESSSWILEFIKIGEHFGRSRVESRVREAFAGFDIVARGLDLFLLHGLLFKSGAASVELDNAHLPGDIVLPGYLAPSETTLKLNASEVTLGPGATYQFTAEPSNGVSWTVSNLPDEEGDCGSIDASGKYTSPAASTIAHAQKVVIVTAASGANTSRGLVTIVKRSIALDPVIMTAEQIAAKDNEYKVSGASLQDSALTWSMSEDAIGSIKVDPNPLPDVQDGRLYVVPKKGETAATLAFNERYGKPMPLASEQWQARRAAGGKLSEADLAEVLAIEQVIVTDGNDTQTIDVLLPLENETHWFEYKPDANSGALKLEFWSRDKRGKYEVPAADTEWFLVRGNGTLVDGLYTPPADGSDSYAVVAAIEDDPRYFYFTYAILPMPYLDVTPIIANEARS